MVKLKKNKDKKKMVADTNDAASYLEYLKKEKDFWKKVWPEKTEKNC